MSRGEQEDIQVGSLALSQRLEAEVNATVFSDTVSHMRCGVCFWECEEELG